MHFRARMSSPVFGDTFVAPPGVAVLQTSSCWLRFCWPSYSSPCVEAPPGQRRNPQRRKLDHQRKTGSGGRNSHTACDTSSNNSLLDSATRPAQIEALTKTYNDWDAMPSAATWSDSLEVLANPERVDHRPDASDQLFTHPELTAMAGLCADLYSERDHQGPRTSTVSWLGRTVYLRSTRCWALIPLLGRRPLALMRLHGRLRAYIPRRRKLGGGRSTRGLLEASWRISLVPGSDTCLSPMVSSP